MNTAGWQDGIQEQTSAGRERPVIAPLDDPFPDVRRILVLRGGGLGDLLFAVPAMRALAAAYPDAELTLLGSRVAGELLPDATGVPHRVLRLPVIPGVGAPPEESADGAEIERFVEARRAEHPDLAVQLHGGGRYSNPFLRSLGARWTVGTRTPDAAALTRTIDYVYYQHEVLRALEVVGLAGAAPISLAPEIRLAPEELQRGACAGAGDDPVVALHPGATDPRRRWPAERFAEVATGLVRDGVRIVLVGDASDREACRRIAEAVVESLGRAVAERISDTAGGLDLRELAAVLASVDVMLGNDSGPRHLAEAVGTRTSAVYWFGNLVNAGPLGRGRHRVQLSWTTRCPVCGRDCTQVGWTAERCSHDVSFVDDVTVGAVRADVTALLFSARGRETAQEAEEDDLA